MQLLVQLLMLARMVVLWVVVEGLCRKGGCRISQGGTTAADAVQTEQVVRAVEPSSVYRYDQLIPVVVVVIAAAAAAAEVDIAPAHLQLVVGVVQHYLVGVKEVRKERSALLF